MSTQEEENELANLSSETVLRAIDAVKGRAWDVNPFTVADELKVSRSLIYRHAEAMKLIIAARGGGFGMDVQTSLDLAWQLRKLEQQNNELKEKLASNSPQPSTEEAAKVVEPEPKNRRIAEEVIFNLAGNEPYIDDYSKQLANMSWKDMETIYHFKVASLKDHARNLFSNDSKADLANGGVANSNTEPNAQGWTSYSSPSNVEFNKQERQNSVSPFARLKNSKTKMAQLQENSLPEYILPFEENKSLLGEELTKPPLPVKDVEESSPQIISVEEKSISQVAQTQPVLFAQDLPASQSNETKLSEDGLPGNASQVENEAMVPNQLASQIRAKLQAETLLSDESALGMQVEFRPPQFEAVEESTFLTDGRTPLGWDLPLKSQANTGLQHESDTQSHPELQMQTPQESPELIKSKWQNQIWPQPLSHVEAEIKGEIAPEMTLEEKPETAPDLKSEIEPQTTPEIKVEIRPEVEPQTISEIPPEIKPKITPEIKPEVVPEIKPEITPEVPPEIAPEIKPEIVPEIIPGITPATFREYSIALPSEDSIHMHSQEIRLVADSVVSDNLATNKAESPWIPLVQEEVLFEQIAESILQTVAEPQTSVTKSDDDTGDLLPVEEPIKQSIEEEEKKDLVISGDELRDLIQSHIKNAADQMGDVHSIGTGKEYEVWLNNPAKSKFVGSTKAQESTNYTEEGAGANPSIALPPATFKPRTVPPEVRKSCLILGIRMDNITYEVVQDAWKRAIAAPGVHPDQGGDTELAVYLNTAKDSLMRWLDAQAPKLGKKFGPNKQDKDVQAKKDKK